MSLLSIILVLVMTVTLVGCGEKTPGYKDGTYKGTGKGMNGDIEVSVEVKDGKISAVEVLSHEETEGICEPAIEQVTTSIEEKNSTEVDIVAGATNTSNGIIEAVNVALEGAK
ncbi:FMN-binding protein [Tissierella praeacuta]|uniref:FMN-binding protein n=1 Tax=Tissierella praeacuta TaxID=43131 RepID=UPI0010D83A23|nr:FMN-binding protein [Tissierella praeacuta]TCU79093.1 FMN-binding protein [Tissierella praeacuta]